MATGKPKSRGTGNARSIRLEYTGKKPVAEVLAAPHATLHEVRRVGDGSNTLVYGENLGVLAALSRQLAGRVGLVYIDPPYATKSAFSSRKQQHAYEDTMVGADFLEFLRERLIFLHAMLADTGSLYLHLDERMVFPAKLLLDEVFGPAGYRNCITRKKCNPKNYTHKAFGNIADYLLVYAKGKQPTWNRPAMPWQEADAVEYRYTDALTGRRYMKVPVHAPGVRNGETGKPWRGKLPPPGKHWQYAPATLDELDARGEIYWSPTGNPRRKVYLDASSGVPVQDIWLDVKDAHNQNVHVTGYPTEKPPQLLRRIIEASSNPGDLVLDCFAGSGTTLAMSHELGRRWVGVDQSLEAIRTTLARFERGLAPMGDFVEKKGTRALFDDEPTAPARVDHAAVSDFTLFADCEARLRELREALGAAPRKRKTSAHVTS